MPVARAPNALRPQRQHQDLILVAGMRMASTRRKLRDCRHHDRRGPRAAANHPPEGMAVGDLRQAPRRRRDAVGTDAGPTRRHAAGSYEVFDARADPARCPDPSRGDLFFDFEGDPMFHVGDSEPLGPGVPLGRPSGRAARWRARTSFWPLWARRRRWQEREALVAFLDRVAAHPSAAPRHARLPLRAV